MSSLIVNVTAHALRRYLERARGLRVKGADDVKALKALKSKGVDLAYARDQIRRATESAAQLGAQSVKCGNIRFLLRGQTVVTVIPIDGVNHVGARHALR